MSRISLDSTLEMITLLDTAQSSDELRRRLLQLTKVFGVEHILAGIFPRQDANQSEQIEGVFLADWPTEWMNRYFFKDYISIDPIIKAIKASHQLLSWSEIPNLSETNRNEDLVMNEAMDFKLIEGLTIPLDTAEGRQGGFSFAGQQLDLTESNKGIISFLANYAFGKSVTFGNIALVAPVLAPRQLDVVRWAAEGKTDWEIGMILNVSEYTVDKYMRLVKEKLKATNRAQLIAKAIRLGLIN